MPHSHGLSSNPYPELIQLNSSNDNYFFNTNCDIFPPIEDRAVRPMKATVEKTNEGNRRDKETEPTIHSYSPKIVHHKGCSHCHICHTAHMEPPYVLEPQTTRRG
jgi:hypothetical protein